MKPEENTQMCVEFMEVLEQSMPLETSGLRQGQSRPWNASPQQESTVRNRRQSSFEPACPWNEVWPTWAPSFPQPGSHSRGAVLPQIPEWEEGAAEAPPPGPPDLRMPTAVPREVSTPSSVHTASKQKRLASKLTPSSELASEGPQPQQDASLSAAANSGFSLSFTAMK